MIDYESLRCLLFFHFIMSFNRLSDNFYICMATILDKMCYEFCTYPQDTYPIIKPPLIQPLSQCGSLRSRKQTSTLYFFRGRYDNIHFFFCTILVNQRGSQLSLIKNTDLIFRYVKGYIIKGRYLRLSLQEVKKLQTC